MSVVIKDDNKRWRRDSNPCQPHFLGHVFIIAPYFLVRGFVWELCAKALKSGYIFLNVKTLILGERNLYSERN